MESILRLYKRLKKACPDYPVTFKEIVEHYKKHSFSERLQFVREMKQVIRQAKVDAAKEKAA